MPNRRASTRKRRSRAQPQQLLLRSRGKRGGYRAGAGRPSGRSDHYVPHVPRPDVTRHNAVHVTLRVVEGVPSLRRPRPAELVEGVFRAERQAKGFRLVHYAIRSNHLHLVCEADEQQALSRGVQRLASRIARRLNRLLGRAGRYFRDRFHCCVVRSPRQARNLLAYVLLNEHKDRAAKGVRLGGIDTYSSGVFFDGWADSFARPLSREGPAAEQTAVTAPKSWLLRVGWRRHGLVRTTEKAPKTAVLLRSQSRAF